MSTMMLVAALLLTGLTTLDARGRKKTGRAHKPPSQAQAQQQPPSQAPQQQPPREAFMRLRPLLEEAERLDSGGQKQAAVAKYLEAIEVYPAFEMTHYNLALTLEELGQYAGATRHYHQTLQLLQQGDSRRFDVLSRLGQLTARLATDGTARGLLPPEQMRALHMAHSLLSEALTLQPDHAAIHLSAGKVLTALAAGAREDEDDAELGGSAAQHFRHASALEPQNPATMVELGLALHRQGGDQRQEEVEIILARAAQLAEPPRGVPTGVAAEFHAQLGLRLRHELPRHAQRHFEASLRLDPQHAQAKTAIYHLGAILRKEAGTDSETAEERALYDRAVTQGIWRHPSQRPGYLAPGLSTIAGPWPTVEAWPTVAKAIALLEGAHTTILAELVRSLARPLRTKGGEEAQTGEAQWGVRDLESLTDSGEWHQHIYRCVSFAR
jgi:tetratricopeptide (TPR) repeat protein